jgi:hypothetical protein
MTTIAEVVQAAIPDADDSVIDFILWERTPYPAGAITARSIYRAASRLRRASAHNLRLCDYCDHLAIAGKSMCARCATALSCNSDPLIL